MLAYDIIYTDPPWPQRKGNLRRCRPNQERELDYPTMTIAEIKEYHLPFFRQAAEKHNVFMWTIDKCLRQAEDILTDCGYEIHARIIWDKTNGIAPAFTVRFAHEYLLWAYPKGRMLLPVSGTRGRYTDVIREPSTVHSRKPNAAYEMLEDMFLTANKVELFARRKRIGWHSFGNEIQEGGYYEGTE